MNVCVCTHVCVWVCVSVSMCDCVSVNVSLSECVCSCMCVLPPSSLSPSLSQVALPLCIHAVDNIVHRRLRFGYDVGKGFVMGEEEMLQQFDRFGGLVHKKIAMELRRRAEATRLDVIKSLGTN